CGVLACALFLLNQPPPSVLSTLFPTRRSSDLTAMAPAERERYLRGWATSRIGLRRKGFQALKRLAGVLAYTTVDGAGTNPFWPALGYSGPPEPAPRTPKRIRPLAVSRDTTLDCDVVVVG